MFVQVLEILEKFWKSPGNFFASGVLTLLVITVNGRYCEGEFVIM